MVHSLSKKQLEDDVQTVAKALLQREEVSDFGEGYAGGIVVDGRNRFGYFVQQGSDGLLVVSFYKKSDTIGRNDPEIKESENNYVEARFYWVEDETIEITDAEQTLQEAREITEPLSSDSKGYLYGHRLPTLRDGIDDLYK